MEQAKQVVRSAFGMKEAAPSALKWLKSPMVDEHFHEPTDRSVIAIPADVLRTQMPIGIDDQAKALASLPAPKPLFSEQPADDRDLSKSHGLLLGRGRIQKCINPVENGVYDADLLCLSPAGGDCQEWRIGDTKVAQKTIIHNRF